MIDFNEIGPAGHFEDLLESYVVDRLLPLAHLFDPSFRGRKDQIIARILKGVGAEGLEGIWSKLTELEKAAVAEAVHGDGTVDWTQFQAKYKGRPDVGPSTNHADRRKSASWVSLLLLHGGYVPHDFRAPLKKFVPRPGKARAEAVAGDIPPVRIPRKAWNSRLKNYEEWVDEIAVVPHETARSALSDLHAVLRLVDAGKVSVSDKTRRVTAAGASAIRAVLLAGDFYPPLIAGQIGDLRPFAWPLILQAAKLANLSGTKLQLTKTGRAALSRPAHEVLKACWESWLETDLLDELNRVEVIKGQYGKGRSGLTARTERREKIVRTLRECPVGEWIEMDEFFRLVRASGNDFSVERGNYSRLYVADQQYGWLGYDSVGWDILPGRYVLAFLFEYAATLGVIDVACMPPAGARSDYGDMWGTDDMEYFSRYDGLKYVRLNPLGAFFLGLTEHFDPPAVEIRAILKVLPNLDIAATEAAVGPAERLFIEKFADPVSDLVWKLTPGKLLEAVEGGATISEIGAFLQATSGQALPETVRSLLDDVERRSGSLADRGPAWLIECADSALAELLSRDTRLKRLCMKAGERHLVVFHAGEAAFRKGLRGLGYSVSPGAAVRPIPLSASKDGQAGKHSTESGGEKDVATAAEPDTESGPAETAETPPVPPAP